LPEIEAANNFVIRAQSLAPLRVSSLKELC
jgi:hypothetical protein